MVPIVAGSVAEMNAFERTDQKETRCFVILLSATGLLDLAVKQQGQQTDSLSPL
jgi:hypothetical protein